jgi:molybdopterin synthase catalytic subunit
MTVRALRRHFGLTADALDGNAVSAFLRSPLSGGEVLFTGVVRSSSAGRSVVHLDFEAYEPMVLAEFHRMADEAENRWSLHAVAIHHRTGVVAPGEVAVMCGVSAAHRKEAFEACIWLMDELKRRVPVWKKEVFENGEEWVTPHP